MPTNSPRPDLVGLNFKVRPADRARVEKLSNELDVSLKQLLLLGVDLVEQAARAARNGERIVRVSKRGAEKGELVITGVRP